MSSLVNQLLLVFTIVWFGSPNLLLLATRRHILLVSSQENQGVRYWSSSTGEIKDLATCLSTRTKPSQDKRLPGPVHSFFEQQVASDSRLASSCTMPLPPGENDKDAVVVNTEVDYRDEDEDLTLADTEHVGASLSSNKG